MVKVMKQQVTQYAVRAEGSGGWARITIDERVGLVMISSDYGDWSYRWSAPGEEGILWFLTDLEKGYFLNKIGGTRSHVLDVNACLAELRKKLIERKDALSEDEIADVEDALNAEASDEHEYINLAQSEPIVGLLYEGEYAELPWVKTYEPGLNEFYERLWVPFAAHLKAELEQESHG